MKKNISNIKKQASYFSFLLLILMMSCTKEFDFVPPAPNIVFNEGGVFVKTGLTVPGAPGGRNDIVYRLQALEGVSSLKISLSINNGAPSTLLNRAYDGSQAVIEETFSYINTATLGDKLNFTFELTDAKGTISIPSTYLIDVGDLFTVTSTTHLGVQVDEIKGTINKPLTLNASRRYLLGGSLDGASGSVFITPEGSLTIPAGTRIYARTYTDAKKAELVVNGTITLQGTAASPVFITSDKELNMSGSAPGDWTGISFGQTSKGQVRYLRVEFAGNPGPNARDGAFNFLQTTTNLDIAFVQAFRSSSEGYRFRGGNVNLKNAVATECASHGFRLDDESTVVYNGKGQFWIVNYTGTSSIELIHLRDGAKGLLSNITMVGPGTIGTAMRVRDAAPFASVRLFNALAAFNATGIRFSSTFSGPFAIGNDPIMAHGRYFSNTANYHSTTTAFNNQLNNTTDVVAGISAGNFVPTTAPTGVNAQTIDSFFEAVDFIGAVKDAASDWTANGSWCKNSDGTIR